ncbi:hypothetical protein AAXE64_28110 [Priestia megaterium]
MEPKEKQFVSFFSLTDIKYAIKLHNRREISIETELPEEVMQMLEEDPHIPDTMIPKPPSSIEMVFQPEFKKFKEDMTSGIKGLTDSKADKSELTPKTDKTYVDAELSKRALKAELDTEKARINNLVANAGNTTGNAELQDIRVDPFGKTFATAGEALRAANGSNFRKMSDYSGYGFRDNINSYYTNWQLNTNGFYKTSFDMAQVKEKSSLNIGAKVAGTSSEFGFVWNNVDDIAVYLRVTGATSQYIGRLINTGSSWGNLQTGQGKKYDTYAPGVWYRVPFTQAELDAAKARTDYQTGSMFAIFDFGQMVGTGTIEYFVLDNRKEARGNKFYEASSFFSENAKFAEKASSSEKAAIADRALTADTTAALGKMADKSALTHLGTGKPSTSTNTIALTQYKSGIETVGYKMDLNILENVYVFTYARVTSLTYKDLKTKKFRIVVKGEQAAKLRIRLTNGTSWGSSDNTVANMGETTFELNESNGYTFEYDVDLSNFSAFYAASQRQSDTYQRFYYIITANEGSGTELNKTYNVYSYAYELGQKGSVADGMESKTVKPDFATLQDLSNKIKDIGVQIIDKIVAWGDSLTAGGGWTTTLSTLAGLPLYNAGTGGENSNTIMARQGGDVMVVNNINIPADTSEILIANKSGISTFLGKKVTPLLQGGSTHFNPCYIGDVEGTLRYTGTDYADPAGTWVFKRNVAGTAVKIERPTALVTNYDRKYNDGIMIIFMGQNGGWNNDNAELIRQHKLMIAHSNAKKVVILGLSSGTAAERASYEAAMKAEFGRYFISLREYLSQYGLADAGITPTQADTDAMALGKTPPSLLTDTVHYNTQCKTVIGNMVYKKMKELNIF